MAGDAESSVILATGFLSAYFQVHPIRTVFEKRYQSRLSRTNLCDRKS